MIDAGGVDELPEHSARIVRVGRREIGVVRQRLTDAFDRLRVALRGRRWEGLQSREQNERKSKAT